MRPELRDRALRDVEAVLRGIAASVLDGPVAPGLLLGPLTAIGDALRIETDIPGEVRAWMDSISRSDLRAALSALIQEIAGWSLPEVSSADDPITAGLVRRRDEAESIALAIRRICLPRGIPLGELTELAEVQTLLAAFDERLAALMSRGAVARLLATRAFLEPRWADTFQERLLGDANGDVAPPVASLFAPSDDAVARYITRGSLPRLVEGAAHESIVFAEELAECIDGSLADRDDVSLVARRWRKASGPRTTTDPMVFASPVVRLAAAVSDDQAEPVRVAHLGALPGIDAEVRLEVSPTTVRVQIFSPPGAVARLQLGSASSTEPTSAGHWEIEARLSASPLALTVIAADGARFVEEIRFAPDDGPDEAR